MSPLHQGPVFPLLVVSGPAEHPPVQVADCDGDQGATGGQAARPPPQRRPPDLHVLGDRRDRGLSLSRGGDRDSKQRRLRERSGKGGVNKTHFLRTFL